MLSNVFVNKENSKYCYIVTSLLHKNWLQKQNTYFSKTLTLKGIFDENWELGKHMPHNIDFSNGRVGC